MSNYTVLTTHLRNDEESISFDYQGVSRFEITKDGVIVNGTLNGIDISKLTDLQGFVIDELPATPGSNRVVFLTTTGKWWFWNDLTSAWEELGLDVLQIIEDRVVKLDNQGNYTGNIAPSQVVSTAGVSLDTTLSGISSKTQLLDSTTGVYTGSISSSQVTNLDSKLTNINSSGVYTGVVQSSQIEGATSTNVVAADTNIVITDNAIGLNTNLSGISNVSASREISARSILVNGMASGPCDTTGMILQADSTETSGLTTVETHFLQAYRRLDARNIKLMEGTFNVYNNEVLSSDLGTPTATYNVPPNTATIYYLSGPGRWFLYIEFPVYTTFLDTTCDAFKAVIMNGSTESTVFHCRRITTINNKQHLEVIPDYPAGWNAEPRAYTPGSSIAGEFLQLRAYNAKVSLDVDDVDTNTISATNASLDSVTMQAGKVDELEATHVKLLESIDIGRTSFANIVTSLQVESAVTASNYTNDVFQLWLNNTARAGTSFSRSFEVVFSTQYMSTQPLYKMIINTSYSHFQVEFGDNTFVTTGRYETIPDPDGNNLTIVFVEVETLDFSWASHGFITSQVTVTPFVTSANIQNIGDLTTPSATMGELSITSKINAASKEFVSVSNIRATNETTRLLNAYQGVVSVWLNKTLTPPKVEIQYLKSMIPSVITTIQNTSYYKFDFQPVNEELETYYPTITTTNQYTITDATTTATMFLEIESLPDFYASYTRGALTPCDFTPFKTTVQVTCTDVNLGGQQLTTRLDNMQTSINSKTATYINNLSGNITVAGTNGVTVTETSQTLSIGFDKAAAGLISYEQGSMPTPPANSTETVVATEYRDGQLSDRRVLVAVDGQYVDAFSLKADVDHTHVIGDVSGLQTALDSKLTQAQADLRYAGIGSGGTGTTLPAWVSSTQSEVTLTGFGGDLAQARITGLSTALAGKANTTHSHAISDVTGLQAALDSKLEELPSWVDSTQSNVLLQNFGGALAKSQVTDLTTDLTSVGNKTQFLTSTGTLPIGKVTGKIRADQIAVDSYDPVAQGEEGDVAFVKESVDSVTTYTLKVSDGVSGWHPVVGGGTTDLTALNNKTQLLNSSGVYSGTAKANSVQVASTSPQNPVVGSMYFDSTLLKLFVYSGTEWLDMSGGGGSTQPATDPFVSLTSSVTLSNSRTVLTNVALETEAITFTANFGGIVPTGLVLQAKADSQNTTNPFTNSTGTSNTAITVSNNTFTPSSTVFPHTAEQNYVWFKLEYTHESTPFTRYGVLTTRLYPQGGTISATVTVDPDSFIVNTITDYALVFAPAASSVSYTITSVSLTPTLSAPGTITVTAPKVATFGPSTCATNDTAITGLVAGTVYTGVAFTISNPLGISTNLTQTINVLAPPAVTVTGAVTLATGHDATLNYIAREDEEIVITVGNLGSATVTSLQLKADTTGTKANNPFEITSTTSTSAYTLTAGSPSNVFELPPTTIPYTPAQNYLWYYVTITFGSQTFNYTGLLKTSDETPKTIRLYKDTSNDLTFTFTSSTSLPVATSVSVSTIKDYLFAFTTSNLSFQLSGVDFTPASAQTITPTITAQGAGTFAFVTCASNSTALTGLTLGGSYTEIHFSITNALGWVSTYSKAIDVVVSPVSVTTAYVSGTVTLGAGHSEDADIICREDETLTVNVSYSNTPTSSSMRLIAHATTSLEGTETAWVNTTASNLTTFTIVPSVDNMPHTADKNYVFAELTVVYQGKTFVHIGHVVNVTRLRRIRLYPQGNTDATEIIVVADQQGLSGTDLQTKCRLKVVSIKDYLYTFVNPTSVVTLNTGTISFTPSATTTNSMMYLDSYGSTTFSHVTMFDSTTAPAGTYSNEVIISGLTQGTTYTNISIELTNLRYTTSKVVSVPITLTTASTTPAFTNAQSVQFNGTSQYSSLAFSYDTSPWSISFWIKILSIPTADVGFAIDGRGGSSIANNPFYVNIQINSSVLRFASDAGYWLTSSAVPLNTWKHFVLTSTGSSSSVYADGAFQSNITTSIGNPIGLGFGQLTIASRNGGSSGFANIRLDEMSLWNVALTAAKVTEVWNSGVPGDLANHSLATNNLQAWWRFSGNGNDSSGKNRHLNMAPGITYSTDVKT